MGCSDIFSLINHFSSFSLSLGDVGGRVVRWSWVNFQCRGVLLNWIRVAQGPTALAVGAGGVVWTFYIYHVSSFSLSLGDVGGRVVRWSSVNVQVRGVLLIIMIVGQGPIALAVGAGGVVWTFLLSYPFTSLSPSLWKTARYRLQDCLKGPLKQDCLKGPLKPKTTNQPNLSLWF